MQFLAHVSMQSNEFRTIWGSRLRHVYNCLTKLSNYLVVDHVAHSTFGASSSPKGKNRTPSGQDKEGAKANHPVYSSCSRSGNFPRRYRIVALLVVKISLIDRFFLIFHNFENVYLFSNPNISAKTVLRYT